MPYKTDKMLSLRKIFYILGCFSLVTAVSLFFTLEKAEAVPSFARQTGYACTACHFNGFGPALNSFGRVFKLLGYTLGKPNKIPPVSAMAFGSFTKTDQPQNGGAAPNYKENENFALDQFSIFYAGRIWNKIGAFTQVTWDGVAKQWALDNTDLRFATTGTLGGKSSVFGIDVNNNPTVQDLWNSTPAWGFPFVSSALAPTPTASTLIDGGFAQQVVGITAYTMWNNHLYLELGPYVTLPSKFQDITGIEPEGENRIHGVAPYWRVVLQHNWRGNYISAGTIGLLSWVYPGRETSAGSDRYLDLGLDATYQYTGFKNLVISINSLFIKEFQNLPASQQLGNSSNSSNSLETLNTNLTLSLYTTFTLIASYFQTTGSTDIGLYSGSANGSPDSNGYILELSYTPFGKTNSFMSPYANMRVGIQYTGYWKFDGASSNYDGSGRNAADNNTLYLYLWWAI
ncbi:MAG: cytochrome C [Thermodesulfobacteriota bacterium]